MELTPEQTTGLVAIVSAFVGALPGLISGFFSRKAEDRNHLREMVMKVTAENWRLISENTKVILPYEHYMIHTAMMCELAFSGKEITEDRTAAHLAKVAAVLKTLEQHAKSNAPSKKTT